MGRERESARQGLDPLWARAPLVLLRFPGLFASLAAGGLLLTIAAASYPLFISATATRLLEGQTESALVSRFGIGIAYQRTNVSLSEPAPSGGGLLYERQDEVFNEEVSGSPYLGKTVATVLGPPVLVSPVDAPARTRQGRLLTRTGALEHVEVIAGTEGDGLWLSDETARGLGVEPGDRISLTRQGGPTVEVPVDGIYRALHTQPRSGYWRAWSRDIYPPPCGAGSDCPPPPPFLLADRAQMFQLSHELGVESATFGWDAPVAASHELTLEDARDLREFVESFQDRITDRGSELYELFQCCGRTFSNNVTFSSVVPQVVVEVERRLIPVEGPVQLLMAAGLLVAIVVIAGAGAFAMAARKVEATLLFARGRSPAAIAGKASLEAVLPCAIGAAAGFGLAILLVLSVGPAGRVDSAGIVSALVAAAVAFPVAVVLVGGVSAVSFLRQSEHQSSRLGALARIPWELGLVALALVLLRQLRAGGAFIEDPSLDVTRPSAYLLLFPVAFVAAFAVLGARVFRWLLGWLRGRTAGSPTALYLAVRRLAGAPRLVFLLLVASVMSVGIFLHAQMVVRSLETTVDAKAKIFVGSDVRAVVDLRFEPPDDFPLPVTKAIRSRAAGRLLPGEGRFDLLAVDPATLASAAYWNASFGAPTLGELAGRLRYSGAGPLPVIVSGGSIPTGAVLDLAQREVPVRAVAETAAFPGTSSRSPLIVADADALVTFFGSQAVFRLPNTTTELWVRGDPDRAVGGLARAGIVPEAILTADEVKDIPSIAAVVDTFGVLNVLSLAAGLLVLVIMLMYLQARQRTQVVSYGLSLRMGLSAPSYRRSLVFELGGIFGAAYLTGLALSVAASVLVVENLDPLATIPPEPVYSRPLFLVPLALAVLAAASWLGGWITGWRARRSDLAEVMRVAD